MTSVSRRVLLGTLAAAPLASPAIVRAKSSSKPVKIGLLSDLNGPYRDVGGIGNKVATQLAIKDFGGSVLGRPIEILQADDQNKPDVASALAREWIDARHVDVLTDGAASSSGVAIQEVCRQKKKIYLITGPASSNLTGKDCSPYSTHWSYDTYALAHGTGTALTKAGGKTWFFITADYEFGYALEHDTIKAVEASGGKVLGKVRAPLGTADFSSYLIQAQASGADVIGLANAGTDTQNCVKQAAEFGITAKGTKIATLLIQISDVISVGQKTAAGLDFTNSFYWDMTPATRTWTKRWQAGGMGSNRVPGLLHAGQYAAVMHWLKAVKAVGSTDTEAVITKMKATPVNDFYNHNVQIREDGRVMHEMYLWQVKKPSESKHKFDLLQKLRDIPPADAWRPMSEDHCYFIKA